MEDKQIKNKSVLNVIRDLSTKGNKIAHSKIYIFVLMGIYTILSISQFITFGLGASTIGGGGTLTITNSTANAWRGWVMISFSFVASICSGIGLIFIARMDTRFIYLITISLSSVLVAALSVNLWLTAARQVLVWFLPAIFLYLRMAKAKRLHAEAIARGEKPKGKGHMKMKKMNSWLLISLIALILALGLLFGLAVAQVKNPKFADPFPYLDGSLFLLPLLSGPLMIFGYVDNYIVWIVYMAINFAENALVNNWVNIVSSLVNLFENLIALSAWTFLLLDAKKEAMELVGKVKAN